MHATHLPPYRPLGYEVQFMSVNLMILLSKREREREERKHGTTSAVFEVKMKAITITQPGAIMARYEASLTNQNTSFCTVIVRSLMHIYIVSLLFPIWGGGMRLYACII